ncbi:response regulator transcription factor [Gaopeijia maritima]|uniref:response regulator transcription factor n=1 Tax=Gaopeijia maritima TaxID=3119007 RepID=UPI0032536E17
MSYMLIVEDNDDLAFGLRRTLEFEGREVDVASDGEAGVAMVADRAPELIILDVMLPGQTGFEVLRELRRGGFRAPILMLTARGEESDVITGFDSGADDYVTKPFSTLELMARVRALLRRTATGAGAVSSPASHPWTVADIRVDPSTRTVVRAGSPVQLTPKEFDLLTALHDRQGAIASRADLLSEVWGYRNAEVATRTVDIHMAELRKKLEKDPSRPAFLLTVRKAGYRMKS